MKKIIELKREIKRNTLSYGNALGLIDREYYCSIVKVLSRELTSEIRKQDRRS